jgi:hypothetical protein
VSRFFSITIMISVIRVLRLAIGRSGRSARRRHARDQRRRLSLPSFLLLPLSLLGPQLQRAGQRHGKYRRSRRTGLSVILVTPRANLNSSLLSTICLPSPAPKHRTRCYARTRCARISLQMLQIPPKFHRVVHLHPPRWNTLEGTPP